MGNHFSWRVGVIGAMQFAIAAAILLCAASLRVQTEATPAPSTPVSPTAEDRKNFVDAENSRYEKTIIEMYPNDPVDKSTVEGPDATYYVWFHIGLPVDASDCKNNLEDYTSKLSKYGFTRLIYEDEKGRSCDLDLITRKVIVPSRFLPPAEEAKQIWKSIHDATAARQAIAAQKAPATPVAEKAPATPKKTPPPAPTPPLWQKDLNVQETDFVEFVSRDRLLVGSVDTSGLGNRPVPHELLLLNAVSGETIWTIPRGAYGSSQTLLAVDPVIILQGSKKMAALNPENGAVIWSRERAGEDSLLLPFRDLMVIVSRKTTPMTVSALNVKTGSEVWRTPVENYSLDKGGRIVLTAMGDILILGGPEVAAFSSSDGKLLWRMPFPGGFGPKAGVVPVGEDLYLSDGLAITKADPATGKQIWHWPISDGSFLALTANERGVFVLSRESGEDPSDWVAALDRATGKQLWKYKLVFGSASPILTEEDRVYVTSSDEVFAFNSADGAVVFRTSIPEVLQSNKKLPDHLRIAPERIIVARENGVLAVRKSDGKILFADAAGKLEDFTYKHTTDALRIHLELDSKDSSAIDNSISSQMRVISEQMRSNLQGQLNDSVRQLQGMASQGYNRVWTQQQIMKQERFAAKAQLVGASATAGIAVAAVVYLARYESGETEHYKAQVDQALQCHANSLQVDYYVRPTPKGLYVVNLETGKHADITYASDGMLSAVAVEGSRIVSIGPNQNGKMTKERAMGMGFLGTSVAVSQTSVLAFDFGSVHFDEPDSAEKASAKNNSQPDEASQLRDDWFGAARYGPLETVQAMLDQHPDLLESTDGLGKTALTAAAENGMTKVVEFLLAKGANVNARDQYGETPLLRAADDDHADTAKVLIANGADVNAKDKFGETPLHFAKEHHNKVIEQILHQHGAQK